MKKMHKQIMAVLMVSSIATFSCKKESLKDELPNQINQNGGSLNDSTVTFRDTLNRDTLNYQNQQSFNNNSSNQTQNDSNYVIIKDTTQSNFNNHNDTTVKVINGDGLNWNQNNVNVLLVNLRDTSKVTNGDGLILNNNQNLHYNLLDYQKK